MCSGPKPGNYRIVNTQKSILGNDLAANLVMVNQPLVVGPVAPGLVNQEWKVIGEPKAPQRIESIPVPALEAAPKEGSVEALPVAGFAWCIKAKDDGYIIEDPNTNDVWTIERATEGERIVLKPQSDSPLQVWKFLPASRPVTGSRPCNGPKPGNYSIINTQRSVLGKELAANHVNINVPLVVGPVAQGLVNQQWEVIGQPDVPQRIVPLADPTLEAAPGREPAKNFVVSLPAAGFAWCIQAQNGNENEYIIEDPNTKHVWAIAIATEGQPIVLGPPGNLPLQVWKFLPA